MMVAVCDYFLIGDELFAASAYLNKEPTMIATIGTGDAWKWISVVGIIIGVLLAFGNIDWSWLLKL
jgi:type IV secretory pathway VirB2 component (pilin)